MIRILIVEDRSEVRTGLHMRLSAESDMRVVGHACSGCDALEQAAALTPDVVLMDVDMPVLDGMETSIRFAQQHPHLPVVILTIEDDAHTRARAQRAHAAGFVTKDKPVDCLIATIRAAAAKKA